ncbi:MAG: DUF6624 domain-containing protein [Muribaculaceae bacterium]
MRRQKSEKMYFSFCQIALFVLPIINAFEKGKLRGEFVAFMQDRIACRSGKPQMYGSQGSYNDSGVFIPAEIEDPENVDARRAKMGMCTLQEYIKMMSRN